MKIGTIMRMAVWRCSKLVPTFQFLYIYLVLAASGRRLVFDQLASIADW